MRGCEHSYQSSCWSCTLGLLGKQRRVEKTSQRGGQNQELPRSDSQSPSLRFLSSQHTLCEENAPPSLGWRGITCTVHGLCHGGCDDAGQPGARPKLQHGATLKEVSLEQDVVCQEQGTPPYLEGRGAGTAGDRRQSRDPAGPRGVDGTYPPACQHPPGGWPWCALEGAETKRERATMKTGMDRTQMGCGGGGQHSGTGAGGGRSKQQQKHRPHGPPPASRAG